MCERLLSNKPDSVRRTSRFMLRIAVLTTSTFLRRLFPSPPHLVTRAWYLLRALCRPTLLNNPKECKETMQHCLAVRSLSYKGVLDNSVLSIHGNGLKRCPHMAVVANCPLVFGHMDLRPYSVHVWLISLLSKMARVSGSRLGLKTQPQKLGDVGIQFQSVLQVFNHYATILLNIFITHFHFNLGRWMWF